MPPRPPITLPYLRASSPHRSPPCGQVRHATQLRRPRRPWTFQQLVTLSDGSTFLQRTTSPAPVLVSQRDRSNHPLWNPSLSSLRNREQDEAGRLAAFRERFGMGFESDDPKTRRATSEAQQKTRSKAEPTGNEVGTPRTPDEMIERTEGGDPITSAKPAAPQEQAPLRQGGEDLMDLISGYSSSGHMGPEGEGSAAPIKPVTAPTSSGTNGGKKK